MNYPPFHNGQNPPQYLQQQPPQQNLPPQLLYNNANSNPPPYQYGKPVHPQTMIPPYPAYADAYNNHRQHRQPDLPQPLQYVNPAELFQQTPLPTPPRPHFIHGPQLDGQAPIPAGSSHPPAPVPATTATTTTAPPPAQSPYHNAHTPTKSTTQGQTSQASSTSSQARPQTTPVTRTPSKPIPQVLIPAPSPEIRQEMQRQTPKKQLQRQTKQPSAGKLSKPSIDYQVLLLSLADEYLNAAHNHGTMVALERREMDVEEYYKLVATGLGCLEAVLKVDCFRRACLMCLLTHGRIGDFSLEWRRLYDCDMRAFCLKKQIITSRRRQL